MCLWLPGSRSWHSCLIPFHLAKRRRCGVRRGGGIDGDGIASVAGRRCVSCLQQQEIVAVGGGWGDVADVCSFKVRIYAGAFLQAV